MGLPLFISPGWCDIPDAMFAAGAKAIEDALVALNSLIRMAACSTEVEYGGGVAGSQAGEVISVGDSSTTAFTHTTKSPILPGTLTIIAGSVLVTDNGAGGFTSSYLTGTVNYQTGAVSLTFTTAPAEFETISCSYATYENGIAVASEAVGTGNASAVTFTHALATLTVAPGSVVIRAGTVTGTDNGQGGITGAGISAGTVNYQTGAVSVTFSAAPATGLAVTAGYDQAYASGGELVATGNNITTAWYYTVKHTPVVPGSLLLLIGGPTVGTKVYAPNAATGQFTGAPFVTAGINYQSGVFGMTLISALPIGQTARLVYLQQANLVAMFEHGDTVPLPQSVDDGYVYDQSEVLFPHALVYSPDYTTGGDSGGGNLLMVSGYVEQDTGKVSTVVDYYVQGGQETASHDGAVQVLCLCRRGAGPAEQLANIAITAQGNQGDPLTQGGVVSLQ